MTYKSCYRIDDRGKKKRRSYSGWPN